MACILTAAVLAAVIFVLPAFALEDSAVMLSFDPADDHSERYMFQLMMMGAHVSPGVKDEMAMGEFMIGTVYKDTVVESLYGLNRHAITFYEYHVRALPSALGRDRNDPRFGGTPWPALPGYGEGEGGGGGGGGQGGGGGGGGQGGGGGGGGQGGGGMSAGLPPDSFIGDLGLPPTPDDGSPLQGGPGGGGGGGGQGGGGGGGQAGGDPASAVNLDTILVTNLEYMTNKQGEVLDISGLETLRKVSKNRLLTNSADERTYVDINISHIFEWTHLLYLPDYPVYKEDIWFHSYPLHIPGLPEDEPVMTKFMYKLIDFRTVSSRKVAVIDMSGVAEWNMEWDDRNDQELTEFKSWGNMGITSRYWFDYEAGEIFGIERPPFVDWQYQRQYGGLTSIRYPYDGTFAMQFPGLVINWEFFYNTRVTDISGKPRLVEAEPEEMRRYIILNLFCQLEAE